ncbi:MAG: HPF/RaiA family ribosome-associated protein [Chromatocurvus sp.]
MLIQINTDDNIDKSSKSQEKTEAAIREVLERFEELVTRVEVHLSDENSDKKSGSDDIRCLLEVRVEGRQPLAVTESAATVQQAVDGAARKMRRSLDSVLGKLQKR